MLAAEKIAPSSITLFISEQVSNFAMIFLVESYSFKFPWFYNEILTTQIQTGKSKTLFFCQKEMVCIDDEHILF